MPIYTDSQENHVKTRKLAGLETEEILKVTLVFTGHGGRISSFSSYPVHVLFGKLDGTQEDLVNQTEVAFFAIGRHTPFVRPKHLNLRPGQQILIRILSKQTIEPLRSVTTRQGQCESAGVRNRRSTLPEQMVRTAAV
jgi:hypothetical protein